LPLAPAIQNTNSSCTCNIILRFENFEDVIFAARSIATFIMSAAAALHGHVDTLALGGAAGDLGARVALLGFADGESSGGGPSIVST